VSRSLGARLIVVRGVSWSTARCRVCLGSTAPRVRTWSVRVCLTLEHRHRCVLVESLRQCQRGGACPAIAPRPVPSVCAPVILLPPHHPSALAPYPFVLRSISRCHSGLEGSELEGRRGGLGKSVEEGVGAPHLGAVLGNCHPGSLHRQVPAVVLLPCGSQTGHGPLSVVSGCRLSQHG